MTDVRLFDEEFNAKMQGRKDAKESSLASSRLDVLALNSPDDLLRLAAAVEARSQHPLAAAIVAEATARGQALLPVNHFQAVAGQGVRGVVDDPALGRIELHIGNARYFGGYEGNGLVEQVSARLFYCPRRALRKALKKGINLWLLYRPFVIINCIQSTSMRIEPQ